MHDHSGTAEFSFQAGGHHVLPQSTIFCGCLVLLSSGFTLASPQAKVEPTNVCSIALQHERLPTVTQSASLLQRAYVKVLVSDVLEHLSNSSSSAVQVGSHEQESHRILGEQPNAEQTITHNSSTAVVDAITAPPSARPLSHRNSTTGVLLIVTLLIIVAGAAIVWCIRCCSNSAETSVVHHATTALDFVQSLSTRGAQSFDLHARESYDEEAVEKFIQRNFRPTALLLNVIGALARFWGMLAIMVWALNHDSTALMDCYKVELSPLARYTCKYTLACLHAYPILCANFTLVLMVRVLVQLQIYYVMLKQRVAVDFVSVPIMRTPWPWICLIQMLQGGLHFVLKTYLESGVLGIESMQTIVGAAGKFIIPGMIFMSFFQSYADVENMLVPLNRIVELEGTGHKRECPWLSKLQVVSERVLARDVRRNPVYTRAREESGKDYLTINDVTQNIIEHYEDSYAEWSVQQSVRPVITESDLVRKWVFRSLWPAAVLTHRRMDWNDSETWEWLCVITLLLSGSALVSLTSLCALIMRCASSASIWSGSLWRRLLIDGLWTIPFDDILANIVLITHGMIVLFFLYRSMWGMFRQQLQKKSPDLGAIVIMGIILLFLGFATTTLIG